MINIGNISFRFGMADEVFAQRLYVGWNEFCRACFTDILEECLGRYDTKDSYIEIDTLDLNLGSIPQETFYEEFPRRVRTELEKVVLSAAVSGVPSSGYGNKRLENLIHCLRYGFCLPGWDMREFDLYEELMCFKDAEEVFTLCFTGKHCFERLTRQLDGWQLNMLLTCWLDAERTDDKRSRILQDWAVRNPDAMRMLTGAVAENRMLSERIVTLTYDSESSGKWHLMLSWLTSASLGHYEKQRCFAAVLDARPQMVLRFIRETSDEGNIRQLALLLESETVRSIMVAETESHAEVDVPEYWHHLYLWLIKHYPFNGVAMFGDKRHFVQHLHERFLFFIRKRSASTYLSKSDLTIRFLLEVFGADYYLEVLNILYHNQPLNDDGSPVSSDYYSREIYYMLLRLSLLKVAGGGASGVSVDNAADVPLNKIVERLGSFENWLTGSALATDEKQILLRRLIKEQPLWVLDWIRNVGRKDILPMFTELVSVEEVFALVAVVSYREYISLSAVLHSLSGFKASVSWMQSVDIVRLEKAYISAVVAWLSSGSDVRGTELIREVLSRVYLAVVRGDNSFDREATISDGAVLSSVSEAVALLAEKQVVEISDNEIADAAISIEGDVTVSIGRLQSLLGNTALSVVVKKRLLLQWLDAYRNNEITLFKAIYDAGLLPGVIVLVDASVLRHIVVRMAGLVAVGGLSSALALLVEWITVNIATVATTVSVSLEVLWERIIVHLISWRATGTGAVSVDFANAVLSVETSKDGRAKATLEDGGVDAVMMLLAAISRDADVRSVAERIIRLYGVSSISSASLPSDGTYSGDALAMLMVRIREYMTRYGSISYADEPLNSARMAFERSLNDKRSSMQWLTDRGMDMSVKREVLKRFAADEPQAFMNLLQMTLNEDTVAVWSEVVDMKTLVAAIASVDRTVADMLLGAVTLIRRYIGEWKISLGSHSSVEETSTRALLLFLLEKWIQGGRLQEREMIVKDFVSYWRMVVTGRKEIDGADAEIWSEVENRISSEMNIALHGADKEMTSSEVQNRTIVPAETDSTGDELSAERLKRMSRAEIVRIPEVRFLILNEDDFDILAVWLSSSEVSDTVKIRLLQRYTRWQQKMFWNFIGNVYAKGTFDVLSLSAWLGIDDWLMLIAGISYSWAETLRQTVSRLMKLEVVSQYILSAALALFVAKRRKDDWYRMDLVTVVKDFSLRINEVTDKYGEDINFGAIEKAMTEFITEIKSGEEEMSDIEEAEQPEYIPVTNAGLCLLAPWLIRLFGMLDLLTEDRKDLKEMDARIRAIFIMQRLVTSEVREYKEGELAFNRLLVGCPFNVPLPKSIELTAKEAETVESMLAGVKANWPKMANTSIGGFQRSFIEREGHLEQQESKWVLTVENKAYDILLDSLPWSYKMIRLPWLKKPISVSWRDKEEFDFDSINR